MNRGGVNPRGAEADRPVRANRTGSIDVHLGSRIRLLRTGRGLSQTELGTALGITFQQVQKYERGMNRVSAARLFDLARVFAVPIGFFFDDFPEQIATTASPSASPPLGAIVDEHHQLEREISRCRPETIALVRAYYGICDPNIRTRVLKLIKSLASMPE